MREWGEILLGVAFRLLGPLLMLAGLIWSSRFPPRSKARNLIATCSVAAMCLVSGLQLLWLSHLPHHERTQAEVEADHRAHPHGVWPTVIVVTVALFVAQGIISMRQKRRSASARLASDRKTT